MLVPGLTRGADIKLNARCPLRLHTSPVRIIHSRKAIILRLAALSYLSASEAMSQRFEFRVVCINCNAVGMVLDGGENASDSTPIKCRYCGAPRGARRTPQALSIARAIASPELTSRSQPSFFRLPTIDSTAPGKRNGALLETRVTDTRLYKVIVGFEDGVMGTCAGIEHEGRVWLVPNWLPFQDEGYVKPERIIRLDQFQFQTFDPPATGPCPMAGANFAVNDSLPKALFFGELSPQQRRRYGILMRPDLKFRTGGNLH